MAEEQKPLGTKGIDPQLALEAAAQMRRPFPGQEPDPKRRKKGDGEDDAPVPVLMRFAYNAADVLKKGCRGLLMTTHMRHERGATKEALAVMQDYGCADKQFSTVKVACTGMVVIVLNEPGMHTTTTAATTPAADQQQQQPQQGEEAKAEGDAPAAEAAEAAAGQGASSSASAAPPAEAYPPFHLTLAVQKLMADITDKKRPNTKTVHRILPMERTSLLEPDELRQQVPHLAAAFKASPLAAKFAAMHAEGRKIPFAVGFKNRDLDSRGSTWNGLMEGQVWEVYDKDALKPTTTTNGASAPAAAAPPAQQPEEGKQGGGGAEGKAEEGDKAGGAKPAEPEASKKKGGAANPAAALRQSVIHVLATSLQAALEPWQLSVNLKEPELVLLCEVIPMAGAAFAGLALVPAEMCRVKSTIVLQSVCAGQ